MTTKSGAERFDEALNTLLSMGATKGVEIYKGHAGVLAWLGKRANPTLEKNAVGNQISVGGFFSDKHPTAMEIRKSLRALLLLRITCDGFKPGELAAIKRKYDDSRSNFQLNEIISDIIKCSSKISINAASILVGSEVVTHSIRLGFPDVGQVLQSACDTGNRVLREAYSYMKSPLNEKLLYSRWFGSPAPEANNRQLVEENIQKVMDGLLGKPVKFTARDHSGKLEKDVGSAAPQSFEQFSKQRYIQINLGEYFFSGTSSHSSQIVRDATLYSNYFDRNILLKAEKISVRETFTNRMRGIPYDDPRAITLDNEEREAIGAIENRIQENKASLPRTSVNEKVSVTGLVIHEATHQIIDTTDIEVDDEAMYGPNRCFWLARKHPNLAVRNADNYRLFCEEFLFRGLS